MKQQRLTCNLWGQCEECGSPRTVAMLTPTLKQCRHLSLVLKFTWALLLLLPLTYFLDFGLTAGVTTTTVVAGLASGSSQALSGSEAHRGPQRPAVNETVAKEDKQNSVPQERKMRWLMRRMKERIDKGKANNVENPLWPKVVFQQGGDLMPGMRIRRLHKSDWINNLEVFYKGQRRPQQQPKEILCALKTKAWVQTLDGTEEPFSRLGWANLVPSQPLDRLQGSEFKSCAVVSSAASILRSSLGKEIDSHDAVLRFNAAPIKGFETDVGTKTTIRLINSQVMTRPELFFNTSSLYQNVTLVAWDPPPYSLDLNKWYVKPDYNLFGPYGERRRLQPQEPFYILHPRFIWQLWDVIQGHTLEDIQPNPPSSGFIGIVLMMALCREVHVYEYVPSARRTARCHYHETYMDLACTFGAYHPLRYEKTLVRKVNAGARSDLLSKGRVTLPGFSTINCGS